MTKLNPARVVQGVVFVMSLITAASASATPICLSLNKALDLMCARDVAADSRCGKNLSETEAEAADFKTIVAWRAESCVYQSTDDIPKDLTGLKNGEAIPTGTHLFKRYTPNEIATALVYRRFQTIERPHMKPIDLIRPGYDAYTYTEPLMAINAFLLPKIIQNGFLNQHQTQTTNGCACVNDRATAENKLIGVTLEATYTTGAGNPMNSVRPKYAYGIFLREGKFANAQFITQYGSTFVAFKDEVKKRATYTNRDSLSGPETTGFRENSYYFSLNSFSFPNIDRYYESQIWGTLTMADVKYILTGCLDVDQSSTVISALSEAKLDIPVYQCAVDNDGQFKRFVPGRQIYGSAVDQHIPDFHEAPAASPDDDASASGDIADDAEKAPVKGKRYFRRRRRRR